MMRALLAPCTDDGGPQRARGTEPMSHDTETLKPDVQPTEAAAVPAPGAEGATQASEPAEPAVAAEAEVPAEPAVAAEPAAQPKQAPTAPADEDFAAMLESSYKAPVRFSRGDRVTGTVISIGDQSVLVDIGGKSTGIVDKLELVDDDGELIAKVGEVVPDLTVIDTDGFEGGVKLSLHMGTSQRGMEKLRAAYEARVPIDGVVKGRNKGGYDVEVAGQSAFCPISQIDAARVEDADADSFVGKTFAFLIKELVEATRRIVVSRADLIRRERTEKKGELKARLREGDVVTGRVDRLREFGAFVDLGGVEGLAHISELSWARVEKPDEILKVGDEVRVKVIGLDWKRDRISLSLKQAQEDPWRLAGDRFVVGERYGGTVVRLAEFGAFVELSAGLDGLLHVSDMTWDRRVRRPHDLVKVGDHVEVQILNIDRDKKRISLGMKQLGGDPWAGVAERYTRGAAVEGTVEKVEKFGVFVSLEAGITALIPNSEMNTPRDTDHRRDFPVGSAIKAAVLEVDEEGHRLTLSRKALESGAERADFREYQERTGGRPEGRSDRPERGRDDRGPRPDDRGPRPGDRGPRPGDRGPRPGDRPGARPDRRDNRDDRRGDRFDRDDRRPDDRMSAAPKGGGFGTLGDLFKDKFKDLPEK